MDSTFALVALIFIFALIFDYTDGFHDAANSIATVVSTRMLAPALFEYLLQRPILNYQTVQLR